jgi:hypothetical protein
MPCLNEPETLETCVRSKAQVFLDGSGISGKIIGGNNGSTDQMTLSSFLLSTLRLKTQSLADAHFTGRAVG